MENVIYMGVFFAQSEINAWAQAFDENVLDRRIQAPHVTLKFRPSKEDIEALMPHIGEEDDFIVDAYGNDRENAGFRIVEYETSAHTIRNMLESIKIPHVTTSVSETGKPVNTPRLFEGRKGCTFPIKPFVLKGKIGAFCSDGKVYTAVV